MEKAIETIPDGLEKAPKNEPDTSTTWLRRCSERYCALFDFAPVGLYRCDPEGHIFDANRAVVDILGYPDREALLGANILAVFPDPDTRQIWQATLEEEGQVHSLEMEVCQCSGQRLWVLNSAQCVYDEEQRFICYEGCLEDITERKRVADALRASEERFRKLADHAYDIIFRYRLKEPRGYEYISPSVTKVLGYTPEEYYADPDLDLRILHPDSRPWLDSLAQSSDHRETLILPMLHKEGHKVWIEQRHWSVFDEDGSVVATEGIILDVTERKEAQDALRDNLHFLETLLDTIPNPVFHKDTRGRYRGCNQLFAEQILGLTRSEALGRSLYDMKPTNVTTLVDMHHAHDWQLLREPGVRVYERRVWCADKTMRNFLIYKASFLNEMGEIAGIVGVMMDITHRKQTEESLRKANESLTLWIDELEQRNHKITLLNEMGDLLQSCISLQEAYDIIAQVASRIFTGQTGALYIIGFSHNIVEAVATWGNVSIHETVFASEECWALRRGRTHLADPRQTRLRCHHVSASNEIPYVCVPLLAQGKAMGVLHLRITPDESNHARERWMQIATMMAEHTALALANLQLRERLRYETIQDSVTGLFNRRYLGDALEREFRQAVQHQYMVGVTRLDIDQFKEFNDLYGHEAGNVLLRSFTAFLQTHTRKEDTLCRYGGKEFVVIQPRLSLEESWKQAEKLRQNVKEMRVQYHHRLLRSITVSVGVASFPRHGATAAAVTQAADNAVVRARNAGCDCVVVADGS
jgi:diguanylate cyclase (GGDEF)-like protein/PAS domain S-box-containing protein